MRTAPQTPALQLLVRVQYRPSSHGVPSPTCSATQSRAASEQAPVWQASASPAQAIAVPGRQAPETQVSAPSQYRPSSQLAVAPSSAGPLQSLSLPSQSSRAPG